MEWLALPVISPSDKIARNLVQQILDLEKFRAQATSAKPPASTWYTGEEAVNEALRRELLLRLDIADYLAKKGGDAAAEKAAAGRVRKILDDREGHRGNP
jgi:hypothetical protein